MINKILPFKLTPQFREYVWGGTRLRSYAERTAEAWVVYEQDLIADGPLAGLTLAQAAQEYGERILGSAAIARTGTKFPLLIKLLDCAKWLSLQVHPDDEQALRWEGAGYFGKMEGWYVIDAEADAQLISGFQRGSTQEMINASVGTKELLDIVSWKHVSAGDSLLIEPGTLHALGPGLLIYEVQQTSDLTYRVYDWDRPMDSGRKLHLEQAVDVLNSKADGKMSHIERDLSGEKELFSCPYFKLDLIKNLSSMHVQEPSGISFHAVTFVEGNGKIFGADWHYTLQCFETILIPASCGQYQIDQKNGACLIAHVPA